MLGRADSVVMRGEVIANCRDIASATELPVNADLENCFRARRRPQTARTQISNSTPISMICELGILKYAPGRWALWCMNGTAPRAIALSPAAGPTR